MPVRLEYFDGWTALGLFVLLAAPVTWMGVRSLAGLGPVRRWVALCARLAVLALMVLILGGVRWERRNTVVEVLVLRDVSESVMQAGSPRGVQSDIDAYLRAGVDDPGKQADDRIGIISFHAQPVMDAIPNEHLALDTRAIRTIGPGTDVAAAIQLALATAGKDAMHRILLFWDGNATSGDLEAALAQAKSNGVPIDVVPLRYDIQQEVLVERIAAPTNRRENEPFSIDVYLRSTNLGPVRGRLSVFHQSRPMDLDPTTPQVQPTREVTVEPGLNRFSIPVPELEGGVHNFRAVFEGELEGPGANDTLVQNNAADAFTFVRGQSRILYIDNVRGGGGELLAGALEREGIRLEGEIRRVEQFPNRPEELQSYDAVVLANVPRGAGGLSEAQQRMLAAYVHDLGGGLVMIGGEEAFGAGGWQGSRLEEVLPVNMDIPAQRQVPKGALVIIMHSCEMPQGNYWAEQCAIKAVETLSSQDEIGVISYDWQGGGGSKWDWPLSVKGDGSKVIAAVKNMKLGDMPSFDDALDVALNGLEGGRGLKHTDARQKHIIVISDGDPAMPRDELIRQCRELKVTISTVTVFTHSPGTPSPQMIEMARATGGRVYGPIESNPNQLPQIFIKEATVVRRSLITEDPKGIPVAQTPSTSEMVKGMTAFAPVYGLVLTSRKPNPQVEMPLVAGKANDPLLAHWQSGLGRSAVFTSDAHNRWAAAWVAGAEFGKFWAQVVRTVSRPSESGDFDVQVTHSGGKGRIVVEALDRDSAFSSFLTIRGSVLDPAQNAREVRLTQTGPGRYEGEFDAQDPGSYVAGLVYSGPGGRTGMIRGGTVVSSSPELRDLRSNEAMLRRVAQETGGTFIEGGLGGTGPGLFRREGLRPSSSFLPIWDWLIPVLMGLILVDVAIRRIAWDLPALRRAVVARVRGAGAGRESAAGGSLEALRKVREDRAAAPVAGASSPPEAAAAARYEPREPAEPGELPLETAPSARPPAPSAPSRASTGDQAGVPAGDPMSGLLAAKRRAREQMQRPEEPPPPG
jgi:uncharacterized membrane protein